MNIPISERLHYKRLNDKGIVIEDIFLKEQIGKKELLVRSTDGLRNDSFVNRPRIEKRYFYGKDCVHVENQYDKNMLYTFVSGANSNEEITCNNCGHISKKKDFFNGCPFCGTYFNIDYNNKSNDIEKDILKYLDKKFFLYVLMVFVIFYILMYALYTRKFVMLIIFLLTEFVLFSKISKCFKRPLDVNFWKDINEAGINIKSSKFYSNLITELLNYYYDTKQAPKYIDLIDFDIIEYKNLELIRQNNNMYIIAEYIIRKIYFKNKKIIKKEHISKVKLKRNNIVEVLQNGYKVIKCNNCGYPIDITTDKCEYCGTINNYKSEWTIDEFILDEM